MTIERIAETFQIAAAVIATLYIPYMIASIQVWKYHPSVVEVRENAQSRYHAVFVILKILTKINLAGTLIVMTNYLFRTYAHLDASPIQAPTWSFLLGMLTSTGLLVVLFVPAGLFLRLKYQIINRKLHKFPFEETWRNGGSRD